MMTQLVASTRRKAAIVDDLIGNFCRLNPSGCTAALVSTQVSWRVKAVGV